MADDPRAGELTTANYHWTKPTVGASDDQWGGYLNADLDSIDSTVHGIQTSVPAASTTTPLVNGTAAVGTGTTWARADHVHPTDTSRASAAAVAALPLAMNDNRIINGDMRIDQRNNGVAGTAAGYTVDRWSYSSNQAGKGAWQRGAAVVGFGACLTFASSSAYASLAGDIFQFIQPIEADMVTDFFWGTAAAQSVTLSFTAFSSLGGAFGGAIRNYAQTRSYPFTFSLVANTWTRIAITIPGDTAGTWVMSGNAGSMYVGFDLGCGTTYRSPANAWTAGNYCGATGAISVVSTNAATFFVTGVKLEIGSIATPFNRKSPQESLADCQRYYQVGQIAFQGYAVLSMGVYASQSFPVQMRANPTKAIATNNSSNVGTPTWANLNPAGMGATLQGTTVATGAYTLNVNYTMDAEL